MSANKLNVEGILLLEQPFAKVNLLSFVSFHLLTGPFQVPYENLRKIFRTSQRYIERELGVLQNASADLSKKTAKQMYDPSETLRTIDGMVGRVEGLKRKVRCSFDHTNVILKSFLINHLCLGNALAVRSQ